ncbi:MAG TPA: phage tail sheath subtilisin-like domain-containing protein [Ilumatobacteraceae bacterium]
MPTYLAPGVYLEEVDGVWDSPGRGLIDSPEPTFEWADASKWRTPWHAAFVGFATEGPLDEPVLVENPRQFAATFGEEMAQGFLAAAVDGYFANGGQACYVVRVEGGEHDDVAGRIAGNLGRTGLSALEDVDDIGFVAVPDLWSAFQAGVLDLDDAKEVQLRMIVHAEATGDLIAVLDPPPELDPQQVHEWRVEFNGFDSTYTALYYPWIRTTRRSTGRVDPMPPSGHVAGVLARCDRELGVHVPPANAVIRQVLAVEARTTMRERDMLNPVGINTLVAMPGSGVVVYGARTLSSDPAWRYLHRRRAVNEIKSAIRHGTSWAVFRTTPGEPDDWDVAHRLVTEISEYLYVQWLGGVLEGMTADEAFVVRCDAFTSPPDVRAAGQLVVEIGLNVGGDALGLRVVYFAP